MLNAKEDITYTNIPKASYTRFGMVITADNIDRTIRAMIMHLDGFLAEAIPTPPAIVGKIPHQMP